MTARTFELFVRTSVALQGDFDNWPSKVQDIILAAAEKKALEVGLPLQMVLSRVDTDFDGNPAIYVVLSTGRMQ